MRSAILRNHLGIKDVTVAKTSLKIASSSLSIFFVNLFAFENYPGTEYRSAVSKLGLEKKIQIHSCEFKFSVKL